MDRSKANAWPRKKRISLLVFFGICLSIAFIATGCKSSTAPLNEKIKRIENGLLKGVRIKGQPYEKMALADRMAEHKVPALSIAVIKDGRIEWAKAYGFRDVEEKSPAATETLFQAASISKPVAAAAALRLVERGLINLDEDVNDKLSGWKIPENQFSAANKVTLRRILSHNAGLTVHGFDGYPSGKPVPTLLQVLNGEKPANSASVLVDIPPGSEWRYSGGGYTVMQQMLIDVLKKPFPVIMKETVLTPARMTLSTYEQPLPPDRLSQSAVGYRPDGMPVEGKRHVYPEMAAAGLWTTPSDLCRFAIEIMNAFNGRSENFLSRKMAGQMLSVQKAPSGLGLILGGTGESFHFGHSGGNEGFRCHLVAFPARGIGAAIMTNSDNGGALCDELFRSLYAEYGLPGSEPVDKTIVPVSHEILDRFAGRYDAESSGQHVPVVIARKADHLVMTVLGSDVDLYPESGMDLFSMDLQFDIHFLIDDKGMVSGFESKGGIKAIKSK